MVSGQQLKFKQASAKARAEGIKPFTKAFGTRMKQLLGKAKKSVKKTHRKKSKSRKNRTRTVKSRSGPKKSMVSKKGGGRKGISGTSQLKKVLLGLGVGAAFSTIAALTRIREIEGVAPIVDAAVGGGVEAQIGTAIPRLIRQVLLRTGAGSGNGVSFIDGGA